MDPDERACRDAKRERMLNQIEFLMNERGLSLERIAAEVGARPGDLPVLRMMLQKRHAAIS